MQGERKQQRLASEATVPSCGQRRDHRQITAWERQTHPNQAFVEQLLLQLIRFIWEQM